MTSILLACAWAITANVIALLPSKDHHWRAAYVLIAVGLPLLVFVYLENGLFIALIVLVAAASILRWPVIYLYRWMRRALGASSEG